MLRGRHDRKRALFSVNLCALRGEKDRVETMQQRADGFTTEHTE